MERPTKFHGTRWLGDKRSQVVYDIDNLGDEHAELIADLLAADAGLCFGPDTLAEARNRCYKPFGSDGAGG